LITIAWPFPLGGVELSYEPRGVYLTRMALK
jgi:hypothetical protein